MKKLQLLQICILLLSSISLIKASYNHRFISAQEKHENHLHKTGVKKKRHREQTKYDKEFALHHRTDKTQHYENRPHTTDTHKIERPIQARVKAKRAQHDESGKDELKNITSVKNDTMNASKKIESVKNKLSDKKNALDKDGMKTQAASLKEKIAIKRNDADKHAMKEKVKSFQVKMAEKRVA